MSLDRSLKSASSLVRHRNVLRRHERLERLASEEKWDDSKPVLGLVKVGNRKAAEAKATPKADAAAAGTAPAAGAAAPAAGGKAAAPAAAAKGAAPAAKAAAPAAKKK
jgi:small basic protein (TIGR04137 family)